MIASASSRWPLPSTPATPTISPRADLERQAVQAAALDVVDLQRDLSELGLGLLQPEQDGPAHHHLGELGLVRLRRRGLAHHGAAPEHRDAVGDGQDLVQLVADEHDRLAVVTQPPQVVEQVLGLGGGQHRRGLVEDQDLHPAVERLQDLDPLLLAHREVLDDRRGVDLETVRAPRARPPWPRTPPRSRIGPPSMPEDDVLGDGEGVHEDEVLVDHPDPECDRVARRGDLHLLAPHA